MSEQVAEKPSDHQRPDTTTRCAGINIVPYENVIMHEQSLTNALLTQVDAIRRRHGAERVTEVRVEVGPLSGVEPLLLATAFEQLAPQSSAAGSRLVIDEVALLAECQPCGREFEVQNFVFRCPTCGGNTRAIRGDEFQLVSVSLQSSDDFEEAAS